jgi:hypothetical protein
MKNHVVLTAALLVIGSSRALSADVAITYSILPVANPGEMGQGRIALQLINVSNQALNDVSVRAVLPGPGHLIGPVLDAVDLAIGETAVLRGDYVMEQTAIDGELGIAWRVSYRRADASAHDELVAGVRQD